MANWYNSLNRGVDSELSDVLREARIIAFPTNLDYILDKDDEVPRASLYLQWEMTFQNFNSQRAAY